MNPGQKKLIGALIPVVVVLLLMAIPYPYWDQRPFYFSLVVAGIVISYVESKLFGWNLCLEVKARKFLLVVVQLAAFLITGSIVSQPYLAPIHIHSSKLNIFAWLWDDCEKKGKWEESPTICTREGLKINTKWDLDKVREDFRRQARGVFDLGYEQAVIDGSKHLMDHMPEATTIKLQKNPFGSDTLSYWLITVLLAGFFEYRLLAKEN